MPTVIKSNAPHMLPNSDRAIGLLTIPKGQSDIIFWHSDIKGLGLRIRQGGSRGWQLQYRDQENKTRKFKLGAFPSLGLANAEKAAKLRLYEIASGLNPAKRRDASRADAKSLVYFGELAKRYLEHTMTSLRTGTFDQYQRNLNKYLVGLHSIALKDLTTKGIVDAIDAVAITAGEIAANRAKTVLGACLKWGAGRGELPAELVFAVRLIPRRTEKSRERVLTKQELKALWQATEALTNYDRIVRLIFLTGCRRSEIGGLQWDEIDEHWITIPASRMKAKAAHLIALLPKIVAELPVRPEDGYGFIFGESDNSAFQGWSGGHSRLRRRMAHIMELPESECEPWTLHDLRRTLSTMMNDDGTIPPHIIEALLAHTVGGVAAVYNRADLLEQRKRALLAWHQIIENILNG